ncbi:hypothetical protein EI94DRAFT_1705614 [Lactarius quietus]|nr:hypothetical protein EI94DRAFT_1705614 [Lactarius quietus]
MPYDPVFAKGAVALSGCLGRRGFGSEIADMAPIRRILTVDVMQSLSRGLFPSLALTILVGKPSFYRDITVTASLHTWDLTRALFKTSSYGGDVKWASECLGVPTCSDLEKEARRQGLDGSLIGDSGKASCRHAQWHFMSDNAERRITGCVGDKRQHRWFQKKDNVEWKMAFEERQKGD